MRREEGKLKSARRKPLRDLSNRGVKVRSLKSAIKKKEKEEKPQPQECHMDNDSLDRILFLHSDISSILRQIDELVIEAVNLKTTNNNRSKELKSFTDLLSEICTSLKPWVPKLKKELASCMIEPNTQLAETSARARTAIDDDDDTVGTPEPSKKELFVSPSPFVSWRVADCTIERGKQLFLLTPLPRPKTVISKGPQQSKPRAPEDIAFTSTALVSVLGSKVVSKNVDRATELDPASPPKIPIGDLSLLVTPNLKNPPKSSMLLEPNGVFRSEKINESHKSTPFPLGDKKLCESTDSDNSGNEVPKNLSFKYPELIGIKPSYMLKSNTKALEASPLWMMSPPKCCTLLESPNEKPVKDDALNVKVKENKNISCQGNVRSNIPTVENTPLWNACRSTAYKGRQPGENTLKKELWTRFEATSTSEFRLNLCEFQDTSEKGFLDRLEEASNEETCLFPDLLR